MLHAWQICAAPVLVIILYSDQLGAAYLSTILSTYHCLRGWDPANLPESIQRLAGWVGLAILESPKAGHHGLDRDLFVNEVNQAFICWHIGVLKEPRKHGLRRSKTGAPRSSIFRTRARIGSPNKENTCDDQWLFREEGF